MPEQKRRRVICVQPISEAVRHDSLLGFILRSLHTNSLNVTSNAARFLPQFLLLAHISVFSFISKLRCTVDDACGNCRQSQQVLEAAIRIGSVKPRLGAEILF